MGLIGSLMVKLGADAAPLKSGLKQGEEAVKQFGRQTEQAGKKTKSSFDTSISSVRTFAGEVAKAGATLMAVTTVPIALAAKSGIAFNSMMEQANVSFEVLLGDAAKAKAMISELTTFANSTPFEMSGLSNASKTLLAFGVDASKVMPSIKMLGDISLGNAQKFDSLSLAYAQVQSTGRLMGQDLLQMVNVGFNPLQIISEKTGMSMADLKKAMENGAVSADMVTLAMKEATSEGGRFYGAMEKISKTQEGQLSTLKDAWTSALGTAVKPISEWLTGEGLPKMIKLVDSLKDAFIRMEPMITKAVNKLSDMFDKFANMTPAQQDFILNSVLITGALAPVITGLALATSGVLGFIAALKGIAGAGGAAALGGISGALPYVAGAALAGAPIVYGAGEFADAAKATPGNVASMFSASNIKGLFNSKPQDIMKGVASAGSQLIPDQDLIPSAASRMAAAQKGTQTTSRAYEVYNKAMTSATAAKARYDELAAAKKSADATKGMSAEWAKLLEELNKTTKTATGVDKLASAFDNLKSSIKSQITSFSSFTGLFDIFERKIANPLSLMRRLTAQVKAMEQWQSALDTLTGRGVSSAMLEDIKGMGPGAVDDVMALAKMTDSQLAQYEALYGRRQGIAASAATGISMNVTGNYFLGAGSMDEFIEMLAHELKRMGAK